MTKSYAGKLSVMVLGLSMALAMSIGTASAKNAGEKKNRGARAKKVRDGAKKDADGAKPNRRKGGQSAKLQAINAIVADLTAELNLTDAQKTKVEEIIKKHLKAPARRKGKAPGDAKKPRGKKGGGKRGGGKKKDQGAAKVNDGPDIDRF